MEMLSFNNLALGFETAFSPQNLLFCFVGVTLGTFIGVLPGIGALAAVAMLLPVSFHLEPATALVMLAGVYYGAEYGGSIASIILNIPGTPSASVTCLDGHPMAQQGRAGVALFMTAIASFCGGIMGVVVITLLSPVLAAVALSFGPAEYFSVMVLGLVAASIVNQGGALKGVLMVTVGVMLSTVGVDINTGVERFTGDIIELRDGVSLVIVAMGLFGISEVVISIHGNLIKREEYKIDFASFLPQRDEWYRSVGPVLRSGSIGSFFRRPARYGPDRCLLRRLCYRKACFQEFRAIRKRRHRRGYGARVRQQCGRADGLHSYADTGYSRQYHDGPDAWGFNDPWNHTGSKANDRTCGSVLGIDCQLSNRKRALVDTEHTSYRYLGSHIKSSLLSDVPGYCGAHLCWRLQYQ